MAADHLLGRVSGLVAACTRRVSRATRRLLRHGGRKQTTKQPARVAALSARVEADDAALWSRRILMGERCQPLDFAGAIHYDSFGRRLARPPTPRSVSSLSCRSSDSIAVSEAISYLENDVV
ncbi:hypothetical protein EJB05_57561, partial [Eragrostis curvula]